MASIAYYLDSTGTPIKHNGTVTRALIGDSLSVGSGNGTTGVGLGALLTSALGWASNNTARGGNAVADQNTSAYLFSPVQGDIYTYWLGANDKILGGNDANREAFTQGAHLALLLHLATKEGTNKVRAQSASVTGTWTNLTASVDPKGRTSSTNGSTLTATVSGTSVGLVGFWQQSSTGQFSVTIDGVNKGTFSTQPAGNVIVTNTGMTYGPFGLVFSGLSNASHTVVITVTSATGGTVFISFVAGYGSTVNTADPHVVVANTHDFTAAGNTAQGTSTAQNTRYKTIIANNVSTAQGLGLNVTLVDADAILADADLGPDGLHCNSGGYIKMRDAFITAIG